MTRLQPRAAGARSGLRALPRARRTRRGSRGFTLLELVLVAAISAVIFLLLIRWVLTLNAASSVSLDAASQRRALDAATSAFASDVANAAQCTAGQAGPLRSISPDSVSFFVTDTSTPAPSTINLVDNYSTWTLTGGATVDTNGVLTMPNTASASAISPLIPISQAAAYNFDASFFADQQSTDPTWQPKADQPTWVYYYGADGVTAVTGSSGHTVDSAVQTYPLNAWSSTTFARAQAGTGVYYVKVKLGGSPYAPADGYKSQNPMFFAGATPPTTPGSYYPKGPPVAVTGVDLVTWSFTPAGGGLDKLTRTISQHSADPSYANSPCDGYTSTLNSPVTGAVAAASTYSTTAQPIQTDAILGGNTTDRAAFVAVTAGRSQTDPTTGWGDCSQGQTDDRCYAGQVSINWLLRGSTAGSAPTSTARTYTFPASTGTLS